MTTRMTDAEVMAELRSDSPLNKARAVLSGILGKHEQHLLQEEHATARPVGGIEMRRREFEDIKKIAEALGATL